MIPTKNQMERDSPRPVPCAMENSRYLNLMLFDALFVVQKYQAPADTDSLVSLPENNVQHDKDSRHHAGPEDRLLPDGCRSIVRDDGCPIDEAIELRFRSRRC